MQLCQIKTGLQGCQKGRGGRERERADKKIPGKLLGRDQLVIILINHLLISNAHITQEWQLFVNTAMTQIRYFTTEIDTAHIANISHEIQLLSEVIKKRDVFFHFS